MSTNTFEAELDELSLGKVYDIGTYNCKHCIQLLKAYKPMAL